VPVVTDPSEDALIGLNRQSTAARLLSGAIHDVNNALMVISATVEMLEARGDVPASMKESLTRLRAQSSRAATSLAQVLVFTRATRVGQQPINLRELVEESLALRDFSIRRAGLKARFEPEGQGPFIVSGNRGDLQQVLLNMIMNAEQALSGQPGTIVVRLSIEDGHVVVRVIDEGKGVLLEPTDRIFEPFVTTHDAAESAGLGLWAARRLMVRHGGTLAVDQAFPAGAVFTMRLPMTQLGARK
jgi:two-component system, NtrC family, sensor kinase